MKDGIEQQKEIATIKPRTLQLKLSDADCNRIAEKAGACGLTVSELLENFIGDLVGGTYSNGSDERDYAERWLERCWFGMFPYDTFLRHLIDWGTLESFLDDYEYMQDMKDNIEITEHEENPDQEEIEGYKEDYENAKNDIMQYYEDYKGSKNDDKKESYEDGVKRIMDYVKELEAFKGVEE